MKRKQYKFKKLMFTAVSVAFFVIHANAQMGVGTKDNANAANIVTGTGNVVIDNAGKIGVGIANPSVALDLRSTGNGSVGIGQTNQTASQAGKGAVRYVNKPAIGVKGYLEFSDGTQWIGLYPYGKPRIVVMANKTTQNTEVFEGLNQGPKTGLMQRRSSYLTHWAEKVDSDSGIATNNFDPVTGEFIAPRTGVYFATFTYALTNQIVEFWFNVQTEAIWEVRDSSGTITQRVKTNNSYASNSGSNTQPVGTACTVSVYLEQGDKLRPFSWISTRFNDTDMSTFNVSGSGVYNALTIVEQ